MCRANVQIVKYFQAILSLSRMSRLGVLRISDAVRERYSSRLLA